ncbi:putative Trp operon repressor [Arthrobacter crystallopoietes BAB-32]|uniref:Putative Trp operon repressor n=1 Tax=Arthrobacter crystallopoietes BAB-32 TaxID=1246476 RepID=N1V224_9MICC|nr:DUF2637 domain-containing protein [Arthrobacter crystallopoietes]EMY34054.1 putative Trp operon repressor [Arthrobacter crystallopoietes BAB-32]
MVNSRIEADGRMITMLALALVGVLAVASFSLSFLGLLQAAAWAGIPEHLRWLVPVVVDSTILVYAVAATVQRARGENTGLSWAAVAFFTGVSVAANAAHVLVPDGLAQPLTPPVIFGAFLASIMPVSLFFATHTTVALAVAPVHGTVAQRRRRYAKKAEMDRSLGERTSKMDRSGGPLGPRNGPAGGPPLDQRSGPLGPPRLDHSGAPGKPR